MRTRHPVILVFTAISSLALAGAALAVEQGEVAPTWHAPDFDGREVDFPAVARWVLGGDGRS